MSQRIHIPEPGSRPQLALPKHLQPKAATVALGYPFGGGVTGFFMQSLLGLQEYEFARMASGRERIVRHLLPQSGLYIDHNRNRIVEKFMSTDAEWLLQIDSDIEFPPTIAETLIARAGHDRKIIAGSVPLGPPLPSSAWMMTEQPGIWAAVPSELITAAGIEVHGIATAVVLIHREVFEAVADREGQNWFFKMLQARVSADKPKSAAAWKDGGAMRDREYVSVGEDLAFCLRAKDAGYSSWCCRVEGLRHHKTIPLSHDFEAPVDKFLRCECHPSQPMAQGIHRGPIDCIREPLSAQEAAAQ